MYNFLDFLAQEQKDSVLLDQAVISAGGGTGKTKCLIYRIVHLVENLKVKPENILVLVEDLYTARFIREELEIFIGSSREKLTIGTVSSLALTFYRSYKKNQQFCVFSRRDMEEYLDQFTFDEVCDRKSLLVEWFDYYRSSRSKSPKDIKVFESFRSSLEKGLTDRSIMVPALMIDRAVHELSGELTKCFSIYEHLVGDGIEFFTHAEYAFFSAVARGKKIWITLNGDHCVLPGALVSTSRKSKPIEDLKRGENVKCAVGYGEIGTGKVAEVSKNQYQGPVLNVTMRKGNMIQVTPNHLMFARPNNGENYYQVALLKDANGSWLSLLEDDFAKPEKTKRRKSHTRVWVLAGFKERPKAVFHLQYIAASFGIPLFCLEKNMIVQDKKRLCKTLEIEQKTDRLMREFYLDEEYPHYALQDDEKSLKLMFFGGDFSQGKHRHLIRINADLDCQRTDTGAKHGEGWYVQTQKDSVEEALEFLHTLSNIESIRTSKLIKATDKSPFQFQPASHLRVGMWMPVQEGDRLAEDIIESIEWEDYDGEVFDLHLPEYANFIVGGILLHNSSPAGGGADFSVTKMLDADFSDLPRASLKLNHRSSPGIVSMLNHLGNSTMESTTEPKKREHAVFLFKARDEHDEVNFVIEKVQSIIFNEGRAYADFGICYRLPSQADVFIEQFTKRGIPHRIITTNNFFSCKEIRDMISYLRLLVNTGDDLSLKRIINVPRRGIGERTIELIHTRQKRKGETFYQALQGVLTEDDFPLRFVKQVEGFRDLISELIALSKSVSLNDLIPQVMEKSGIILEISKVNSNKSFEAIANVKAFEEKISTFFEHPWRHELSELLDYLALRSPLDDLQKENSILLVDYELLHQLEFPVLFLPGMEDGIAPYGNNPLKREMDLFRRAFSCGREKIFISWAVYRRLPGESSSGRQSTLLDGIQEFLEIDELQARGDKDSKPDAKERRQSARMKNTIDIGDLVSHRMWGRGTVRNIEGRDEEAMVTIDFDNEGEKKLLLKYAPLERIG
ncbi:MAG: 3'-5' exonuclease [Candidatus Wallbacteria bacterium]|nr:3'-5' exonuclease [Candidatus Wallbacteria bacterium]